MLVTHEITLDPILASLPKEFADPRILPRSDPYFNIFRPGGDPVQVGWRLHDMSAAIASCHGVHDSYISQAFFKQPNRRAISLFGLTHAWVDLDYYKCQGWLTDFIKNTGADAHQVASLVLDKCREIGIPPTSIQSSGRGLYVKWSFTNMVGPAGAARVRALNRQLVRLFADFGADPAACDVSRVLRVPGSINSKTGTICTTLYSDAISYDYSEFCDEILPLTLDELHQRQADRQAAREQRKEDRRGDHRRKGRILDKADWSCKVVADMTTLADMRWGGRVPEGQRDTWTWIAAAHLALWLPPSDIQPEVEELLHIWQIEPDFIRKNKNLTSVINRAKKSWSAKKNPDEDIRYKFGKETLIKKLEIDKTEMANLNALIDKEEKYKRHKKSRNIKNMPKNIERNAKKMTAIAMAQAGGDLIEIAKNTGINVRTLRRWRKENA
ncbi:hypothetical protein [Acidiphilium sp.]|uniref:hypothetical protein n=1 Tax=Acidiphilium sp. TaxID=527 RepID=UPI00258A5D3E|nr:hypothetical protein [Acidiphilium sp.]